MWGWLNIRWPPRLTRDWVCFACGCPLRVRPPEPIHFPCGHNSVPIRILT